MSTHIYIIIYLFGERLRVITMATTESSRADRTETASENVYIHGTAPASVLQTTNHGRRVRNAVSRIKRTLR